MPGLLPTSVYFVRIYALDTPRVSPLWSASFNGVSWQENCIVMSDKYTWKYRKYREMGGFAVDTAHVRSLWPGVDSTRSRNLHSHV